MERVLHAGADIGRGSSEVAGGTVMFPMRFVWPHGGRVVFLNGSFTGRNKQFKTLVEGCPTVFQAVCNLTPGYYQYKFCVDGEWRHDHYQPNATTPEYGTVNTVILTLKPDNVPAILSPDVITGSSMDVDNEAFQHVVRISDGKLGEAVPRISEADLEHSRQIVSKFLSNHTVYELLPESGKVIAFDVELPVKQAFHILYEQGISMAPLWDFSKGHFVGVLSALDFILIMRELRNHASNLTEEELESHTISAWKEGKLNLKRLLYGHSRAYTKQLIEAGPYENLRDVARKILEYDVATVPVIHSSSQDGSYPQLLHLASLSEILKCICRYFRHCASSLPILQLPIYALPVGTWVPKIGETNRQPLAMLRLSASLSSALDLLVQAKVSSIPIVDDNDSLLDIYSRSDITALAKERVYAHINLNEMTIHQENISLGIRLVRTFSMAVSLQADLRPALGFSGAYIEYFKICYSIPRGQALQLGQETFSPFELRTQRCQMCLRSDSLHKVMERLANPGVRRLVVVEAGSKRVEGIVSLSDIFKLLLGQARS